MRFQETA